MNPVQMNILEFPCNLLLEIFSYIDKRTLFASVRKVCQYFYRLSFDRSLWKTVSMNQFRRTLFTTKSFHELLSGAQNYVQCLHLDMVKLDDMGILHEGITCINIKDLYIYAPPDAFKNSVADHMFDLDQMIEESEKLEHIISLKKYLSSFCERYPKLNALHIQNGGLDVGYLSDKFLDLETFSISEGVLQDSCREFFDKHPLIQHLFLKSCMIEPSAVPIVLSQLPKLETLDFSETFFYEWDNETNVVEPDPLFRLRKLCVDGQNDDFLRLICNKMPELRKLSIKGSLVKDKELIQISKHCPKLETLLIKDSPWAKCYITNDALCAIADSCTNLQVLHTNYCTLVDNIGIQRIIESWSNLRELGIAKCKTLTDEDISSLVENCPNIQKLNLRGCTGLTSKSISAILVGCKSLTKLNLQSCCELVNIRITDESLPNIGATGNNTVEINKIETDKIKLDEQTKNYQQPIKAHSHIRKLNLQHCLNLSNKCLEQISVFCPDLRDVDLECCSSIKHQGVITLVQCCKLLEKLNLTCRSIYNPSTLAVECLSCIAKYCKNLRILIMTCIHITADGIFNVIQNCPRIELIQLSRGVMINLDIEKLEKMLRNVTGKVVRMEDRRHLLIYIYGDY